MFMLRIIGVSITLFLFSVAAYAAPIQATYTIDANTQEPGLRVATTSLAPNPFSYDLNVGESVVFDLFEIGLEPVPAPYGEGASSPDPDDLVPKPITVQFGFDQPANGTATITGTTKAGRGFFDNAPFYIGAAVNWNGPVNFAYGENILQIALSDEAFASGDLINLGKPSEIATVQATLTLVDGGAMPVPAPGTLALFALSVLGIAVAVRRRSMQSV